MECAAVPEDLGRYGGARETNGVLVVNRDRALHTWGQRPLPRGRYFRRLANSGDNNAQRRSQRVMVKVSVGVLTQGADDKPLGRNAHSYRRCARCKDIARLKSVDR